jgi:hypothetical protein
MPAKDIYHNAVRFALVKDGWDILTEYHQLNEKSGSQTESALAFDEVHEQYVLLLMGWHKDERIK